MDPVYVINTNETYVNRFRLYGSVTTFKFNPVPKDVSEIDWLKRGFASLVERMKADSSDNDQLGFTLTSLNLKSKQPGYVAFRPASQVHQDLIWDIFGGIIQSNAESIKSTDTFKIQCTRINLPVGSGKKRSGLYNNFNEECKARKGIVVIKNSDNLCLARALVVGKAHAKKDPQYKAIRQDKGKRQLFRAKKLMAKARVVIPENGAGVPELEKFQEHLKKYKITVYNFNMKGREVYFNGGNESAVYNINLLFNENHFNVITSLTAAFVCNYYCEACHIPYDHKGKHRCQNICPACQTVSPPCKLEHDGITCPKCNLHFKSQICFIAHQNGRCKSVRKCTECGKIVRVSERKSEHVCGEVYCKTCAEYKPPNHQCFMRVDTRKPKNKDFLFIFFDLETRQDEFIDSETKVHKVNLCVSQQFCHECLTGQSCKTCGSRTRIFREDPVNAFMTYVMDVRKAYKNVTVLAHNGSSFDCQFLLKFILNETKFTPDLIMQGTKIILMELDNVRFIDSLNYFPMALSALPKAFDLPPEKKKGYFPHLFNTVANQNYVGPIPSTEFYCPDSMFDKGHKDFTKWHDEQVKDNYVFDFQKEIVEYCISDVDILAQAALKFRSMFLEQCNVDPFLEAVTIASACNLAFRRNFLKQNTIGLVPKNGYRLVYNQSSIALQWMTWEEDERNVRIQHAGREREVKVEGMKVDGFDGKRIYEFQGCYWYGCPKCFPYKREDPLKEDPSDSLHLRYERTRAKIDKLSKTPYEVVEMWECTFKALKENKKLTYLDSLPILNTLPLKPRDSFFGGRTGNAKTYHKCVDYESIQYVDVCSLYPWVCKYGKYPVGHPTIHVGDIECRKKGLEVEGLLKCKVLPPRDLYHPVLPVRMNDKLMFVLCRTCCENLYSYDCEHSSEERVLVGTWTMDEIRKAVEKGYVILDMYELWEYTMATFENGGLFTDFINTFLKIKQEASGWPAWCKTDDDRDKYVKDYFNHEGILLDPSRIEKNGGLRSLSKLMLNSFWGKFGQRENQTKALIIRDPSVLFQLATSPSIQINMVQEINEEALLVNWQYLDEVGESLKNVNVVLAAYTTAQARLKLYEYLDILGEKGCYYDTDSIIYLHKEGEYKIPTGDYLGHMTDELTDYGHGSYISEFVSGGPKTYGYKVLSPATGQIHTVCKVKGLTLNLKTSEKLNFDKLKEMVLCENKESLVIEENRIRRTKDKDIVTIKETKVFKVTGAKRKRQGEYDTLPYGYKRPKTQ